MIYIYIYISYIYIYIYYNIIKQQIHCLQKPWSSPGRLARAFGCHAWRHVGGRYPFYSIWMSSEDIQSIARCRTTSRWPVIAALINAVVPLAAAASTVAPRSHNIQMALNCSIH